MRLLDAGVGWAVVREVRDPALRVRLLQVGMAEGALVKVVGVLPGGTRVVEQGQSRWALGRGIARRIEVQPV